MDWTFVIALVLCFLQLTNCTHKNIEHPLSHVVTESKTTDASAHAGVDNIKQFKEPHHAKPRGHDIAIQQHHYYHSFPWYILHAPLHTIHAHGVMHKLPVPVPIQNSPSSHDKQHIDGLTKGANNVDVPKPNISVNINVTHQSVNEATTKKQADPGLSKVIETLTEETDFLRKPIVTLTLPTSTTPGSSTTASTSTSTLTVTQSTPLMLEIEEADKLNNEIEQEIEALSKFDTSKHKGLPKKHHKVHKREVRAQSFDDVDYATNDIFSKDIDDYEEDDRTKFKRDVNQNVFDDMDDDDDDYDDDDYDDEEDDDDIDEFVPKQINKPTNGKRSSSKNVKVNSDTNDMKSDLVEPVVKDGDDTTLKQEEADAEKDLELLKSLSMKTDFLHKEKHLPPKPSFEADDVLIDNTDESGTLHGPKLKKPNVKTTADHYEEDMDIKKKKPTSKIYKEFRTLDKPFVTPLDSDTKLIANAVLWIGVGVGTAFSAIMFILCCSFYRCLFKYRESLSPSLKRFLELHNNGSAEYQGRNKGTDDKSQYVISMDDKAEDDLAWSSEEEEVFDVNSVKQLKKVSFKDKE